MGNSPYYFLNFQNRPLTRSKTRRKFKDSMPDDGSVTVKTFVVDLGYVGRDSKLLSCFFVVVAFCFCFFVFASFFFSVLFSIFSLQH